MKGIMPLLVVLLFVLTACPNKKDVIDGNQERKVGYLFYTEFIESYNDKLNAAFTRFKNEGVTDLIIDLRYNHGGSLSAASYLASLIAPRSVVSAKPVFTQLDFNSFVNSIYGNDRQFRFNAEAIGANLNLKTVYIIATSDSYSAAELLTFCLRPYMNVVHIGGTTGGKFTASFTVTAYDDYDQAAINLYEPDELSASAKDSLKDWAMQPIVAIYKDSKGADFSGEGTLIPDISVQNHENDPGYYLPIGDPGDYLLSVALAKIQGADISTIARRPATPRAVTAGLKPAPLMSRKEQILTQGVVLPPVQAADGQTTATGGVNTVSTFVHEGLSVFYKWADYVADKAPTTADNDPEAYFYKILYPLDTEHGWSWITDDASSLLAEFSGTPTAFGWGLSFYWLDGTQTRLVAIVQYIYPNTPASRAGIARGDVISKINGSDITAVPGDAGYYLKLTGGDPISIVSSTGDINKTTNLTPTVISTNPVLKDTVYALGQ